MEMQQLLNMGFPDELAAQALAATGGKSTVKATEWILTHKPTSTTTTTNNPSPSPSPSPPPPPPPSSFAFQPKLDRFFQSPSPNPSPPQPIDSQQHQKEQETDTKEPTNRIKLSPTPLSQTQTQTPSLQINKPSFFINRSKKQAQTQTHTHEPLYERLRPRTLDEVVGQDHLLSANSILRFAIQRNRLPSILLWGPPDTGKTTIAKAIVNSSTTTSTFYRFVSLSTVTSGVKDVREVVDEARKLRLKTNQTTVLFVDEVHRFNKSQQDSFLPVIEDGSIVFVGATTENPSFHLITSLLSRCRVLTLNPLQPHHLGLFLNRAVTDSDKGLVKSLGFGFDSGSGSSHVDVSVGEDVVDFIANNCDGDARVALNVLEIASVTAAARVQQGNEENKDVVGSVGISVAVSVEEAEGKVILFIDEIHLVLGAGRTEGSMDAANLFKPKLAKVLIALIYFEYPLILSSVFLDFLPHLHKGNLVIDMFCRVLNALDDELISLDYPRTPEELTVACRVKDVIRQQCVSDVVRAWYDIISMYRNSDQELCVIVLDSMRRYISWIDIGLIYNDVFVPLLFDLILVGAPSDQLQGAAIRCLLAVVSKRIKPQSKLSLLQSLQISRVFRLVTEDGNADLVPDIAALLSGYAVEALDCFKRISSEEAKGISMELLDEVLPSVFYIMKNFEVDATFNIVQFLSGYVSTLKSLAPLSEKHTLHVGQILEVILGLIRYNPEYRNNLDVMDKIGREEEDRMSEFRKDLFVLLRTVGRVAFNVTHLFTRNSLASAISRSSDSNVEKVEGSLSLLYALGESLSEEAIRTGSGLLSELLLMLLSTKFPCHSNRLGALVYLEIVLVVGPRIVQFKQWDPE